MGTVQTTTMSTANELPAAPCQHNERFYHGLGFPYAARLESPRECYERCRKDPRCQIWAFKVSTRFHNCYWWDYATGPTGVRLVESSYWIAGCLPGETKIFQLELPIKGR